jgi:DNA (cytosine-5)-methyltransferase 1
MPQTKLKLLDLFSGLGGFSLGLESTGFFETIAFVEKDEFCQKVLKKNFKNIPIEGDIRNVKGEKYRADVVTGGFPCQPFSVAGKRKGTDDDRYLWDETIRVVRECKPKWFIGENVEGLVNIQDGMVLRQVQNDLEEEGFEVQCLIIPASGIGAWHQRKRIWIIGYNVSNTNTRFGIGENQEIQTRGNTSTFSSKDVSNTFGKLSDGCSSTTRNSKTKFKRMECNQSWNWNEVRSKTERCSEQVREDVSNSKCIGTQVQTKGKHTSIKMSGSTSQKTWWQTQSDLCGVPNGVSYGLDKNRANRIKALGNSIVPQIARELGLAIMEAENE